jgi:hypothetical protein
MRGTRTAVFLGAVLAALVVVGAATAERVDTARGWGVELVLPDGWTKVAPASQAVGVDPRTALVIGTEGVRAVDSNCQVSSYRVPVDGAVVVVLAWRDSVGVSAFLPLSGLKLRRGTFSCFDGRGAVAQITRRGTDYQVNVMVGDRASAETIADALDAARSISAVARRHD